MSRSAAITLALGLCVGCGGSSNSSSSGDDAGGSADSSGTPTQDATSGAVGADSAGGGAAGDAGGGGPGNTGADAAGGNSGNGNGQDCTSCLLPTPFCCVTFGGGGVQSVTCVTAQSACPSGTSGFACLQPSDCASGMICCESGTGTSVSTSCASSCPITSQVCQVPADCPSSAPDCPMNGNRGDIGYGVCSPLREAGAPREAGGGTAEAGADGATMTVPEGGAADVAVPSDGGADAGGQDAASGG